MSSSRQQLKGLMSPAMPFTPHRLSCQVSLLILAAVDGNVGRAGSDIQSLPAPT